ncbi:MAG: hypothetical protein IJA97_07010 [Clostridia bacterium]|nr:hypothetical protein [Clostridia bacterium]
MAKKRITKLLITLMCAILVLPLTLNLYGAKAEVLDPIDAYYGVDFTIKTSGEVKSAGSKVKIELDDLNDGVDTLVELFNDGKTKTENALSAGVVFSTNYSGGKAVLRISKPSNYNIIVTTLELDPNVSQTIPVTVYNDIEAGDFKAPVYNFDETAETNYKTAVNDATYEIVEGEEGQEPTKTPLFIGDTYKVPTVESLVDTGSFPYAMYKRTAYYSAPGSSSYTSTSASGSSTLSFNLTKTGTYRFYVLLSLDSIDGKSFSLTTKNTVEDANGFYKVYKNEADKNAKQNALYVSGSGDFIKYYEDEDLTVEYLTDADSDGEIDVVQGELVVPVFEFTVINSGPKIKIKTTYQENGYIGLEYTVKSIEITGNDLNTTYTLQYKATESDAWTTATEEYANNKFTPEKQGYYRVKVETVDASGLTAGVDEEKATAVIKVTEKLQKVEYQTSFKNWLSVNKVPFIFLVVSAVCLVMILVLVLVPAKAFDALGAKIKGIFKKKKKADDKDEDKE